MNGPRDASPISRRESLRRLATLTLCASPLASLVLLPPRRAGGAAAPLRAAAAPVVTAVRARALRLAVTGARAFRDGVLVERTVGVGSDGRLVLPDGPVEAERVVDGRGLVMSPGFVDILGDNSSDPERTYLTYEQYKLADGVTTALQMHGGAPDARQFHARFGPRPHLVNYGVSTKVMTLRDTVASHAERLRRIERSLDHGALGVSHSLEYQRQTTFEEVVAYARLARAYDRPLVLHLRHSSPVLELEGVREALDVARATGVRLHVAHLHSTGGTHDMEGALALLRAGRAEGLELTTCVYPYSYWATYLHSQRFDPGWQRRFGLDHEDLTVVGTGERLTAESFARYRRQPGILVSVPEGTMPLDRTVDLALREDFCIVGSDGGIERARQANSHPRGAGCFATAVRHAQDAGIGLERVLAAVTSRPAALVNLGDGRGRLRTGAVADLTLFDPAAIRGRATVANPNQFSDGIRLVVVGGRVAYEPGSPMRAHGTGIVASSVVAAAT